jgi:hypothetical protein
MGYPAGPPARQAMSGTDLAVSIAALVLTAISGIIAACFGMFSLAFLDSCPPESCSAEDAFTAVATSLVVALGIAVIGLTVTIVRLYRRRTAWPFAVTTLALCVLAFFLGGVGYAVAVGA